MALRPGLLAWYDLAVDANEQHGGLHATNIGGVTFSGGAAHFNGTNWLETPATALPPPADWSFMVFARYADTASGYQIIWQKGRGTATPEAVVLYAAGPGMVQLGLYKAAGGSAGANVVNLPDAPPGWVCLYGEYVGEQIWLTQIGGVGDASPPEPADFGARATGGEAVFIGHEPGTNFAGSLKRLAFWNKRLTPAERTEFFNGGPGLLYSETIVPAPARLADRQFIAPPAANSIAITPAGTAWANSAFVELLAAAASAIALTGVTVYSARTGGSFAFDVEVDIATGAAGAEVVIATVRGYVRQVFSPFGGAVSMTCILPIPINNIAAGSRVAARLRKNDTDTTTPWKVAMSYVVSPATLPLLTTSQPQKTLPSAAVGVTVTTSTTAWTSGAWAQLRAATGPALIIVGVVLGGPNASADYELDLGTGGAGAETVITTIRATCTTTATPAWLMLPTPLNNVAASTRLAARLRHSGTGAATMTVSLMVFEAPL